MSTLLQHSMLVNSHVRLRSLPNPSLLRFVRVNVQFDTTFVSSERNALKLVRFCQGLDLSQRHANDDYLKLMTLPHIATNVRRVSIRVNKFWDSNWTSKMWQNVTHVSAMATTLGFPYDLFGHMRSLRVLHLDHSGISRVEGIHLLEKCGSLQSLALTNMGGISLSDIFTGTNFAARLQHLALDAVNYPTLAKWEIMAWETILLPMRLLKSLYIAHMDCEDLLAALTDANLAPCLERLHIVINDPPMITGVLKAEYESLEASIVSVAKARPLLQRITLMLPSDIGGVIEADLAKSVLPDIVNAQRLCPRCLFELLYFQATAFTDIWSDDLK